MTEPTRPTAPRPEPRYAGSIEFVERVARADHDTRGGLCRETWELADADHKAWHRNHYRDVPRLIAHAGMRVIFDD